MIWNGENFAGAKIALLCGASVVAYRRDDKPEIPHPGAWDLPGGGREGGESPIECALRETEEEFGLALDAARIHWSRFYDHPSGSHRSYFFVADISQREVDAIRFGDEGQYWRLMPIGEFLTLTDAVHSLQRRLADFMHESRRAGL